MESMLLNYGVLGLWVVVLLYQQYDFNTSFKKLIKNNTDALIRNNEIIKNMCENKNKRWLK